MSRESPHAMRIRLLKQLMAVPLPAQVRPDGATPSEIAMFKSLFTDELVIGDWRPNPQNTRIAVMIFTGFSTEAHKMVDETRPIARAKRSFWRLAGYSGAIIVFIRGVLGPISDPQKLRAPAKQGDTQQEQAITQPSHSTPPLATPTPSAKPSRGR